MARWSWRRHAIFLPLLLLSTVDGERGGAGGWGEEGCVVQTEGGAVRGQLRPAHRSQPYLSFRGIPYAEPPVAHLRYKSPQRVKGWEGVLEAREEGPACPQHDVLYGRLMRPGGFSEACLTINVHAPLHSPPGNMPVLVFLHGGGFGFGSGDSDLYGPEYLVTKGVIVVTFNYRLGALGFLSVEGGSGGGGGGEELPENLGLRDMVAALAWVRRNIAAFGGDARRVTLGGQSAGAVAVHLLAASPAARGLFSRCILMSGVAMRSWFSMSRSNAKRVADVFLSKLNITTADGAARLRQLRAAPVERIVQATREMQETEGINVFGPVVELPRRSGDPLVADDPYEATVGGGLSDVPMLIGHTDAECETFARRFREVKLGEALKAFPALAVPPSLLHASTPAQNARHAAQVAARYLSENTSDPERVLRQFVRYCTDAYFAYPALELAQAASRHNAAPVYLYEFAHDGHYSPIKKVVSGEFRGAGHIEDMTYLLRTNSFPENISRRANDDCVNEWMTTLFSNFIKTGSTTATRACGELAEWPAYEAGGEELSLRLGRGARLQRHAYSHLLPFFRSLHSSESTPHVATAPDTDDDLTPTPHPTRQY